MTQDEFSKNMATGVFWITHSIAQGAYPNPEKINVLKAGGITHIFNVGTMPSAPATKESGMQVIDLPIVDLQRLPNAYVLEFLDQFHTSLSIPNSKAYIHCIAGQNRSPTLLWLYLLACGLKVDDARHLIEERTLDAVAGHAKLIDVQLVQAVQMHGKSFLPLKRTELLEPA
jgi:hypothetical protein